MYVTPFRHAFPSRLSVTPFRHAFPSRLPVTPFRHAFPSRLSVTPFRHAFPSRLSVTPFRHAFPCFPCFLCFPCSSTKPKGSLTEVFVPDHLVDQLGDQEIRRCVSRRGGQFHDVRREHVALAEYSAQQLEHRVPLQTARLRRPRRRDQRGVEAVHVEADVHVRP